MEVITGTIILKDGKIKMVKELKKECFGKWSFPAGHLKDDETIFEGAKRETLEETGCIVNLKKVFPILKMKNKDFNIIMILFLGDLVEETDCFDKDEIHETKWFSIDEIKNMKKEDIRCYEVVENVLEALDKNILYDLDIFKEIM